MAKPSKISPERKLQVVLSVLRGGVSVAEAARRAGVGRRPRRCTRRVETPGSGSPRAKNAGQGCWLSRRMG